MVAARRGGSPPRRHIPAAIGPGIKTPRARIKRTGGAENVVVMARPLRFVPPGSVVEVTARTIGCRYLLRPDSTVNDLVLGIIGRAQQAHALRIHGLVVMSNHIHLLVTVDSAAQLAAFMRFVLANIAKEVGRHHKWSGRFWGRRYRSIVVADATSQVARLRYIFANGCQEGLVERPEDWPGVSSARALTKGDRLWGTWYDRSAEYEARRRGRTLNRGEASTVYEVMLSAIPEWAQLGRDERRAAARDLAREVEAAARRARRADGKKAVLGVRQVMRQHPHEAPSESDGSPAPLVHALTKVARASFMAAYRAFVDAYRSAAKALRTGCGRVTFPENAFPPAGPFMRPALPPAPA
jgi:REP element-mobilizing transposase RayT